MWQGALQWVFVFKSRDGLSRIVSLFPFALVPSLISACNSLQHLSQITSTRYHSEERARLLRRTASFSASYDLLDRDGYCHGIQQRVSNLTSRILDFGVNRGAAFHAHPFPALHLSVYSRPFDSSHFWRYFVASPRADMFQGVLDHPSDAHSVVPDQEDLIAYLQALHQS